jgi:hypothetical protein
MRQSDEKLFAVAADFNRARDSCGRLLFCASNPLGGRALWVASLTWNGSAASAQPLRSAAEGDHVVTIDEKPKRRPATAPKRLKNIAENPAAAVIVDDYDEDWTRLGWVMLRGRAAYPGQPPKPVPGRRRAAQALFAHP